MRVLASAIAIVASLALLVLTTRMVFLLRGDTSAPESAPSRDAEKRKNVGWTIVAALFTIAAIALSELGAIGRTGYLLLGIPLVMIVSRVMRSEQRRKGN